MTIEPVIIAAPFTAMAAAMSYVPDEVFASNIVGPGIALIPTSTSGRVEVFAPVSGVVAAVFPHAFSIDVGDSRNVLVHLGIDTVELRGDGFELHVSQGDTVERGDLMISWEPSVAEQAGYALHCPVVAVQAEDSDFDIVAELGQPVTVGTPLAVWRLREA